MSPESSERPSVGLILVRYGIGVVMVVAGLVMIAVNPEDEPRRGRRWTLAPGVITAEDQEAERQPERSGARVQGS